MEDVELACAIARRDFGDVVSRVLRALLQYPSLRHGDIRPRCGANPPSQHAVDDALAVLLMHGIAYAEARAPRGAPKAANAAPQPDGKKKRKLEPKLDDDGVPLNCTLMYKARLQGIMWRTRCARYLWLVGKMYGETGQEVATMLLQRGRMSSKAIVDLLSAKHAAGTAGDSFAAEVENVLVIMVKSGTMRWKSKGNKGPVRAGIVHVISNVDDEPPPGDGDESDGSWDPAKEAEREREAQRREEIELAIANVTEDEDDPMNPAYDVAMRRVITGRGMGRRLLDAPLRDNDDDLWILSTWFLDRMFRNYTCQQVVRSLISSKGKAAEHCVMLFRVGLNVAIEMDDPGVRLENADISQEVPFFDLRKAMDRGGYVIDDYEFQQAVQTLIDIRPIVATVSPPHAPTGIVFCIARTLALTRHATLQSTIQQKYELQGLRVWNALALHGCMLEEMLAEKTMIDVKSVREILYKLMAGGFVAPQEVPKSVDTRAERVTSSIWFLWRADIIKSQERMLDDALRATLRVLLKAEELESSPLEDVDKAEEKRVEKLKLLEATVNRLDQLIILFRDFGPITDSYWEPLYDQPDYY